MNVREQSHVENNLLFDSIIRSTFLRDFHKSTNKRDKYFSTLEINLSPICNLGCKYCYINKHMDGLYPKEIRDRNVILDNLKMLLKWLSDNDYNPNIDLFSGDPLTIELGIEALEIMLDHYRCIERDLRPESISVPNNFSFILDKELTNRIEILIKDFSDLGIVFFLSASIDGLLIENETRPFLLLEKIKNSKKHNLKQLYDESSLTPFSTIEDARSSRNIEFYDKVFKFCKKYERNTGFHPMIYSTGIDKWKDNFLWFQEMFKKYNFHWNNIYLLEVRNAEWNKDQINHFYKFMEFLVEWQYEEIYNKNVKEFIDNLLRGDAFNITKSIFTKISRGIGCSFQTTLYVRMGDLAIIPCHRTSYDHLNYGKFKTYNGSIIGFENNNVESMIQGLSFNVKNLPMCQTCLVKDICNGGCLGAQLEETGSMYMPIPTVCELEHAKILSIISAIEKIGGLNYLFASLKNTSSHGDIYAFKKLLKIGKEVKNNGI